MTKDKLKRKAQMKEYFQRNKEKILIQQKVWRAKNKDILKTKAREYFQKNKKMLCETQRKYLQTPPGKEAYKRAKRKQSIKKIQWMRDFKKDKKCARCGQSFPDHPHVLDFHHNDKDKQIKKETPSQIYHRSFKAFLREIEKCEVVCSNCHRIIHDEINNGDGDE